MTFWKRSVWKTSKNLNVNRNIYKSMSNLALPHTYETLFSLLRNALHSDESIPSISNFSAIIREARRQTVDGLLYGLAKMEVIPEERAALMQWLGGWPMLEKVSHEFNAEVVALAKIFDAAQIRYVVLKGQASAVVYPHPLLRRPGDIDIYVAPHHFEKATELLLHRGYVPDHQTELHDTFRKGNIEVELHRALQPMQWPGTARRLRQRVEHEVDEVSEWQHYVEINNYKVAVLPPHLNVILLTAHALVHASHGGVGLREVVDWMLVQQHFHEKLDASLLRQGLQQLHLTRFYRMLSVISMEYLGANASALLHFRGKPYDSVDCQRAQQLLQWIMRTGKHGSIRKQEIGWKGNLQYYAEFLTNAFRFYSWSPTEFVASPPQMLKRALKQVCRWK